MPSAHSLLHPAAIFGRLLCCITLAALSGCEKNSGPTRVSGQVVEISTGQPVPNAGVQLRESHATGRGYSIMSGGSGGTNGVGTPHPTDAKGYFDFTFEAQKTSSYSVIGVGTPNLNYQDAPGSEMNITSGRANNDLRLPVYARAWVRVQLVDEPPKNDIYITVQGFEETGVTIAHPRDTVFVRTTLAGFKTSIAWFINDQGKESQSYQEIQPTPLDTVTVRITF